MSGIKSSVRFCVLFCVYTCPIICVAAERGSLKVLCNPLLWNGKWLGGGTWKINHPPHQRCALPSSSPSWKSNCVNAVASKLEVPIDQRATTTSVLLKNLGMFLRADSFSRRESHASWQFNARKNPRNNKKSANENNIFPIWQAVWQLQIFAKSLAHSWSCGLTAANH